MGLMARHVLHGQITTFIWGEAYGGPQEIFFGGSRLRGLRLELLALRLAPFVVFLAAVYVTWRVGLRLIGRSRAPPPLRSSGSGPASSLRARARDELLRLDLLYCTLDPARAADRRAPGRRPGRALRRSCRARLLGDVADRPDRDPRGGVDDLAAPRVPAAGPGCDRRLRPRCAALARLECRARLGVAPPEVRSAGLIRPPLRLFFSPVLPMLLGLRIAETQAPLVPVPLLDLVYAALLALFPYGAWRTRRQPVSLLYLTAAVYPFVYSVAQQTFDATAPRYVFILAPVLVLLFAQLTGTHARAAAVVVLCCAVSVALLHRFSQSATRCRTRRATSHRSSPRSTASTSTASTQTSGPPT